MGLALRVECVTTAREALATLKRAVPTIGDRMALLVLTIGRLESHWADHWRGTPGASPEAAESHNWGAIHAGGWSGPTFTSPEKKWQRGQVVNYTGIFRVYPSAEAGAKDLWQLLATRYTAAVDQALAGNWGDVSAALFGYYTGTGPKEQAIAAHRRTFLKALEQTRTELGMAPVLSPGESPGSDSAPSGYSGWVVLLALWLVSKALKGRL